MAIDRHSSVGFKSRGALLAAALRANGTKFPKTRSVGTVAAENVDGLRQVGDGTQRDWRPDGDRQTAYRTRRTTQGPVNPIVNPCARLLVTR